MTDLKLEDPEAVEVTLALLGNLPAWRARAIERIELSSALWLQRKREIHVRALSKTKDIPGLQEYLKKHRKGERVELILPLAEFSKSPLLDIHFTVAGKAVYRSSLEFGAALQARFIEKLASEAKIEDVDFNSGLHKLLAATFFLTRSQYIELWEKHSGISINPGHIKRVLLKHDERTRREYPEYWGVLEHAKTNDPVKKYLRQYLPTELVDNSYGDWYEISSDIRDIALAETKSYQFSSTENPLLAFPHLLREMKIDGRTPDNTPYTQSLQQLRDLLSKAQSKRQARAEQEAAAQAAWGLAVSAHAAAAHAAAAHAAAAQAAAAQAAAAEKLLRTYAAGGHRWMAFARCRVPVDEPFIIRVGDARLINFLLKRHRDYRSARPTPIGKHVGKTSWITVRFNDASTNHVSVRVTDTAVRLSSDCRAMDGLAKSIDKKEDKLEVDEEKTTSEFYLRHDSDPQRPDRIYIKISLRLIRLISCFLYLAMAITAFGEALLILRAHEMVLDTQAKTLVPELTAKDAAVILIPVAFVAAFVLTKDASTLAMRLKRVRQTVLMVELFVLLGTAFSLYVAHLISSKP